MCVYEITTLLVVRKLRQLCRITRFRHLLLSFHNTTKLIEFISIVLLIANEAISHHHKMILPRCFKAHIRPASATALFLSNNSIVLHMGVPSSHNRICQRFGEKVHASYNSYHLIVVVNHAEKPKTKCAEKTVGPLLYKSHV